MTHALAGQEKVVMFKAIRPGVFVYHCATAMAAEHVTGGMYGLILVELEKGLPPADRGILCHERGLLGVLQWRIGTSRIVS
jgi:nitrite reductase (NO-forming)